MKSDEYEGICRICFNLVKTGEGIDMGEYDNIYHKKCSEADPENYNYALDRIENSLINGSNPIDLMDEMEKIFKIPALNDPDYNEQNKKVISLYRRVTHERDTYMDPKAY